MEQRVFIQPGAGLRVLPEPQHSLEKQHSCLHRLVRKWLQGVPSLAQSHPARKWQNQAWTPSLCVRLPHWSHTSWLVATIFSPSQGSLPGNWGASCLLRWPLEDRATLSAVLPDPRREQQVGVITSGGREATPVFPRPERSAINLPDLAPETQYEPAAPRPL